MSSTSADEKPRRVTRKRATRKSTTATRKRTVKRPATDTVEQVSEKPVERVSQRVEERTAESTPSTRKAPTPFATQRSRQQRKQRQMIVVGAILFVGIGASAGMGFTDPGVIDVDATIEARNERLGSNTATAEDTERTTETVQVQNRGDSTKPDGGLIGLGSTLPPATPPPPATTTASSTATTTDEMASSTNEEVDETPSSIEATTEEEVEAE